MLSFVCWVLLKIYEIKLWQSINGKLVGKYVNYMYNEMHISKPVSRHDDNFVSTGGTAGCR